jgi:hypothetical protein
MSAKLFLTDYASYNEGNQFQFGHWVDLTQFTDVEKFQEYIKNHFLECDKKSPLFGGCKREETMFTAYEGFPENFYHESMSFSNMKTLFKYLEFSKTFDIENPEDVLRLAKEHNEATNQGNRIFINDEDFFDKNFSCHSDAVRAALFGDYNYAHDYVMICSIGNTESFDKNQIVQKIDLDTAIEWKLENL